MAINIYLVRKIKVFQNIIFIVIDKIPIEQKRKKRKRKEEY